MTEQQKCTEQNGQVAKLQIAQQLREYHHKSLWEEEKHFTWILSIILSATLLVIEKKIFQPGNYLLGICGILIFGAFISLIGFLIVRREGEYFWRANKRFVTEYNDLYPSDKIDLPKGNANKNFIELVISLFTFKIGVRDGFQILLFLFFIIFLGTAVFTYNHNSSQLDPKKKESEQIAQQANPPDCQSAARPASR